MLTTRRLGKPDDAIFCIAPGTVSSGESATSSPMGCMASATVVDGQLSRGICLTSLIVMSPTGLPESTTGYDMKWCRRR